MTTARPLIIDCDTGEDDAIALVLAVAAGLPLKYVVTTHGNTTTDNATENSARILSLIDAADVKVIKGAKRFLEPHKLEDESFTVGEDFLGKNGICNIELPPSKYDNILDPGEEAYVDLLIDILKKEGPVDYIITGPCTNFAKLCQRLGPDIKKYIHSLTIMGTAMYERGTRGAGVRNTSHERGNNAEPGQLSWAEFNIYCDPTAAAITFAAGLNPLLVTWDMCINFELPMDTIEKLQSDTPGGQFVIDLMKAFMHLYGLKNKTYFELCDPLTIMAFLGHGHVRPEGIRVITDREFFGRTDPDPTGYPTRYFWVRRDEVRSIIDSMMQLLSIHSE